MTGYRNILYFVYTVPAFMLADNICVVLLLRIGDVKLWYGITIAY